MAGRSLVKSKEMRELVGFAEKLGFSVQMTNSGHVKFNMAGRLPVFTSSTPSDGRAWLNAKSQLRRVAAGADLGGWKNQNKLHQTA